MIEIAGRWLVDVTGIEPATPCLQSTCVSSNSFIPYAGLSLFSTIWGICSSLKPNPNVLKTFDSCTVRAQQYPWGIDESGKCNAIREKDGGRGRDRTGDPLLAKQVLSQLSYTPTVGLTLIVKHSASSFTCYFIDLHQNCARISLLVCLTIRRLS